MLCLIVIDDPASTIASESLRIHTNPYFERGCCGWLFSFPDRNPMCRGASLPAAQRPPFSFHGMMQRGRGRAKRKERGHETDFLVGSLRLPLHWPTAERTVMANAQQMKHSTTRANTRDAELIGGHSSSSIIACPTNQPYLRVSTVRRAWWSSEEFSAPLCWRQAFADFYAPQRCVLCMDGFTLVRACAKLSSVVIDEVLFVSGPAVKSGRKLMAVQLPAWAEKHGRNPRQFTGAPSAAAALSKSGDAARPKQPSASVRQTAQANQTLEPHHWRKKFGGEAAPYFSPSPSFSRFPSFPLLLLLHHQHHPPDNEVTIPNHSINIRTETSSISQCHRPSLSCKRPLRAVPVPRPRLAVQQFTEFNQIDDSFPQPLPLPSWRQLPEGLSLKTPHSAACPLAPGPSLFPPPLRSLYFDGHSNSAPAISPPDHGKDQTSSAHPMFRARHSALAYTPSLAPLAPSTDSCR